MDRINLHIPSALKHANSNRTDGDLQEEALGHVNRHPGLQFLVDVLAALHSSPQPLRTPEAFYRRFGPQMVLDAFNQRADLRARLVRAMTGGPTTLLRRLPSAALVSQIELLAADDIPDEEREIRGEADRALSICQLYLKYLDPSDIVAYLPAQTIWEYETQDHWWKQAPNQTTRALMAVELKAIRRYAIMSDTEILDILGDETFERDLPLAVRVVVRKAARQAAREQRQFTDSALFPKVGSPSGERELFDEMVESISLVELRKVVTQAATLLGLVDAEAAAEAAKLAATHTPAPVAIAHAVSFPAGEKTPAPVKVPHAGATGRFSTSVGAAKEASPDVGRTAVGHVSTGRASMPEAAHAAAASASRLVASAVRPSPGKSDEPPAPDDLLIMVEER